MATIFISAGEASGERYGALLIESLRNKPGGTGPDGHLRGDGRTEHGGRRPGPRGARRRHGSHGHHRGDSPPAPHLPRISQAQAVPPPPPSRCRRADRFSRYPFQAGPGTARAGRSGDLFRKPAAMGLEKAPHQAGAEVRGPHAGDFSLRGAVLSRARREGGVCRPPAGGAGAPRRSRGGISRRSTISIRRRIGSPCCPGAVPRRFATTCPKC